MGMTASFSTVTTSELNGLQADPTRVPELFLGRLQQNDPLAGIDIDKSWAAIHFMLTGSQWGGEPPASLPILGGIALGEDVGYGPVRLLNPQEVQDANALLHALPAEELKRRFIPQALEDAEVYPAGIWLNEGEEGFGYIAHWYEALRAFYKSSADRGNAVLLAIV